MKAENVFTPTPEDLQELFDVPNLIPQEDLAEYKAAELRYLQAREELEQCANWLSEALVLGRGIADGNLTATLSGGKIVVTEKEGEQ